MKYLHLYALSLMFAFCTFHEQSQTDPAKANASSKTKDTVPPYRPVDPGIYSKYEFTDSIGKRLVIQNSLPRGGRYTDPNGKNHAYAVFWTRIINETNNPLEATINFPVDSFEVPSSPAVYMKLLLPPDTMTMNKVTLYDYGLKIKSVLDNYRYQASSSKRTIYPKTSIAFYVVAFSDRGVNGVLRTEFRLKEQDLFYRINDKEIPCGRINVKNLRLKE
ncbi:MAG TPA: hypothetical protein VFR58_06835 [Flavisolibacter sp.]|nr:hypothetical protein [Flavisolibacter sp.]